MGVITKILHKADRDRYWIFIDGAYCTSIRARTFPAMGLNVGDEHSCESLKKLESFFWKQAYGQKSWEAEKVRIDRVTQVLQSLSPRIAVEVTGFGANSNELIEAHPEVSGEADLTVRDTRSGATLCLVEVTGTANMRGSTYWVRPDKIKFAQNNDVPVWIAVHYSEPQELLRFIQPRAGRTYRFNERNIRGAIEYYVEFRDSDAEVFALSGFSEQLLDLLN